MALTNDNTNYFISSKDTVAEFVNDLLNNLRPGSQLTTTIRPDEYGVYCAITATDDLLAVIEKNWGLSFYD